MNVLFLTLAEVYDLNDHDIYQDLMRCFASHGHRVYVVTGAQRSKGLKTKLYESCGCQILRVKVGNQTRCSIIEKGISTVMLQYQYLRAVKKYLKNVSFDLILYATPPITLMPMIKKLKRRNKCKTYLMLKDIFPQNAVDLGMMSAGGFLHRYFRNQERKLYEISDNIGCMSPANIAYLQEHNSIADEKVALCPNALQARDSLQISLDRVIKLKEQYGIAKDRRVLVYGGNLGKPQGIPFLMRCLDASKDRSDMFFLIVGGGTEFSKLKSFLNEKNITNARLIEHLPRDTYYELMCTADVGMIFLDHRFTIPNFPSRILPYMENQMPVACVTDVVTDVGRIAQENGFGWRCASNDIQGFMQMLDQIASSDITWMGRLARKYLEQNYAVENCYQEITKKVG